MEEVYQKNIAILQMKEEHHQMIERLIEFVREKVFEKYEVKLDLRIENNQKNFKMTKKKIFSSFGWQFKRERNKH